MSYTPIYVGVLIQWNGGMERNGMSAALATHVLQPTDDLILDCISHLVTMIGSECEIDHQTNPRFAHLHVQE